MDPKKWTEKDADGNKRDPWTEQWYLPLVSVKSGEVVTFVTGSKSGIGTIRDLCRIYGHKHRDGLLPIVALKAGSYKNRKYNTIVDTPELSVVGWDDGGAKEFDDRSGAAGAPERHREGRRHRRNPTCRIRRGISLIKAMRVAAHTATRFNLWSVTWRTISAHFLICKQSHAH